MYMYMYVGYKGMHIHSLHVCMQYSTAYMYGSLLAYMYIEQCMYVHVQYMYTNVYMSDGFSLRGFHSICVLETKLD